MRRAKLWRNSASAIGTFSSFLLPGSIITDGHNEIIFSIFSLIVGWVIGLNRTVSGHLTAFTAVKKKSISFFEAHAELIFFLNQGFLDNVIMLVFFAHNDC